MAQPTVSYAGRRLPASDEAAFIPAPKLFGRGAMDGRARAVGTL